MDEGPSAPLVWSPELSVPLSAVWSKGVPFLSHLTFDLVPDVGFFESKTDVSLLFLSLFIFKAEK